MTPHKANSCTGVGNVSKIWMIDNWIKTKDKHRQW